VSRGDLLANVVAYVPLGILIGNCLPAGRRLVLAVVAALLGAAALSSGLELVQACLPARTSSIFDVAANAGGAVLGALFRLGWRWLVGGSSGSQTFASLAPQPLGPLAAAGILAWLAQQTFPWVVTLDVGQVRQNLVFLKPLLEGELPIDTWRLARHFANWMTLGLLCTACLPKRPQGLYAAVLAAGMALIAQALLAVSVLSIEQIAGLLLALPVLLALQYQGVGRLLPGLLLGATLMVTTVYMLRPGAGPVSTGFSWLPELGAGDPLSALQLGLFFFACSLACAVAIQWKHTAVVSLLPTAITVTAWHALLEVAQLWVPGRIADTSSPLLVAVGFALAMGIQARQPRSQGLGPDRREP
jgi:VanZ family protein